jgi:hypothetical protein
MSSCIFDDLNYALAVEREKFTPGILIEVHHFLKDILGFTDLAQLMAIDGLKHSQSVEGFKLAHLQFDDCQYHFKNLQIGLGSGLVEVDQNVFQS